MQVCCLAIYTRSQVAGLLYGSCLSLMLLTCLSCCAAQDVVTREGKMLFLYKRPGQRVILNAAGHMMVRPTHMEASVQKSVGGTASHQAQAAFAIFLTSLDSQHISQDFVQAELHWSNVQTQAHRLAAIGWEAGPSGTRHLRLYST